MRYKDGVAFAALLDEARCQGNWQKVLDMVTWLEGRPQLGSDYLAAGKLTDGTAPMLPCFVTP
jgi:hypothetical protein